MKSNSEIYYCGETEIKIKEQKLKWKSSKDYGHPHEMIHHTSVHEGSVRDSDAYLGYFIILRKM
jgi:hypothetical protein